MKNNKFPNFLIEYPWLFALINSWGERTHVQIEVLSPGQFYGDILRGIDTGEIWVFSKPKKTSRKNKDFCIKKIEPRGCLNLQLVEALRKDLPTGWVVENFAFVWRNINSNTKVVIYRPRQGVIMEDLLQKSLYVP